jgi:chorismate synthase
MNIKSKKSSNMASNRLGKHFALTTFGESHGIAIGGVIDGCPAGIAIDLEHIARCMARRKPGQSNWVTPRREEDEVQFLSGIYEGKTTGAPIAFVIYNNDQRSKDYQQIASVYRPGHADFVYEKKYGHRDPRGGGRSSARETACRVVAGAIAQQLLLQKGIQIRGYLSSMKDIIVPKNYGFLNLNAVDESPVRCPDPATSDRMVQLIEKTKAAQDSIGGIITCVAEGVPVGWGSPMYEKLNAQLAHAMFTLNAVKGFEMGDGFSSTFRNGSQNNDAVVGGTNHDGGITAGISNGKDIWFKVAFKPTSSIGQMQTTLNQNEELTQIQIEGRHDSCVAIRAVPVVEALTAITLYNAYLETLIENA